MGSPPSTTLPPRPFIYVLAGVNGAGKSSVAGARIKDVGLDWFNPDTFARELVRGGLPQNEANARAWEYGRKKLQEAIEENKNFAFETTLGGKPIATMLREASRTHDVIMWYCGLSSPEQHIARVASRVARGGHPIPEEKIRERWNGSRLNVIDLLPYLACLQVYDNSKDVAPGHAIPEPVLILETASGQVVLPDPNDARALAAIPQWAKQIVQAAVEHHEFLLNGR